MISPSRHSDSSLSNALSTDQEEILYLSGLRHQSPSSTQLTKALNLLIAGAKEVVELEKHLGILELAGMPGSSCIRVQPACAITGEGLHEGLDTLYQLILKRRKLAKLNRKRAR